MPARGGARTGAAGTRPGASTHVLTSVDLDRIKGSVAHRQKAAPYIAEEKRRRKEISDARVKTWGNTLDALRRRKDEDKVRRLEDYEKAQQKLDAEEEAYRAAQRAATIERAEAMLYEQTDRVKALNEKLLLSDVQAERQAQIARRKRYEARLAEIDRQHDERQRRTLERANELEAEKVRQRELANQRIARAQQDQLDQLRHQFSLVHNIVKEDGDRMKERARQNEENDRVELHRQREKAASMMRDQRQCNEYLQKLKAEQRAKEEAEDETIRKYAERHTLKVKERKQKQHGVRAQKQAARQKLIDSQAAYLKTLKDSEDQRIQKQVEEKEKRDSDVLAEKERKKVELRKSIEASRRAQLQRKQEDEEKRQKAEAQEALRLKRAYEASLDKDRSKGDARLRSALNVKEFQRKQVIEKHRNERVSREKTQKDANDDLNGLAKEDAEFMAHAQKRLGEWEAKERDLAPMNVLLNKTPKITTNSF